MPKTLMQQIIATPGGDRKMYNGKSIVFTSVLDTKIQIQCEKDEPEKHAILLSEVLSTHRRQQQTNSNRPGTIACCKNYQLQKPN
jgi:hypothetical protein